MDHQLDAPPDDHLDGHDVIVVTRHRRDGMHDDEVVLLPRRFAIMLRGRARTHWMHGICRNDSRTRIATRISATFRTMAG